MNALKHIYDEIETESDSNVRRMNKISLYTLVNYLEATESLPEFVIKKQFLNGKEFSNTFQKLISSSVVEQTENGNYKLNSQFKAEISPLLKELTSTVLTKDETSSKVSTKRDPTLELLYNCRSEMFSS